MFHSKGNLLPVDQHVVTGHDIAGSDDDDDDAAVILQQNY